VHGGAIFGKPADSPTPRGMLALLSGRRHDVLTAISVRWERQSSRRLRVHGDLLRARSGRDRALRGDGEPFDKAGAYAVQGRAAAFIPPIEGSYSG